MQLQLVFRFLPAGSLLRAGVTCKLWNEIANSDELWIYILARSAKPVPGLNSIESFHVSVQIYSNMVSTKHMSAKRYYVSKRKKEFRSKELMRPGSTARFKVFPTK
jgi:hypothetical protein